MFAEEDGLRGDPRLQAISEALRIVPHFPKPGVFSFLFFFFEDCCFKVFFAFCLFVFLIYVCIDFFRNNVSRYNNIVA